MNVCGHIKAAVVTSRPAACAWKARRRTARVGALQKPPSPLDGARQCKHNSRNMKRSGDSEGEKRRKVLIAFFLAWVWRVSPPSCSRDVRRCGCGVAGCTREAAEPPSTARSSPCCFPLLFSISLPHSPPPPKSFIFFFYNGTVSQLTSSCRFASLTSKE